MALTELKHTRVEDAGPGRVTFLREFECLASEVTQGEGGWLGSGVTLPAYGDDYPYSTWSGLPTPRMGDLRVDPDWQPGVAKVWAYYFAPRGYGARGEAEGTDKIELNLRRWEEFPGRKEWQGVKEYSIPGASVEALMPDFRTMTWTQNGITLTPYSISLRPSDPDHPGNARVILIYRFGDRLGAYQPERARISIEFFGEPMKLSHCWKEEKRDGVIYMVPDTDKPIETEPDENSEFWAPITGDNRFYRPQGKLTIRTALPQSKVRWLKGYQGIGHTNMNVLQVGEEVIAYPGDLLLLNVSIPEYFIWDSGQSIVPVRYDFLFRPGGFEDLQVRKFRRTVKQEYVMHITDEPVKWAANPAQSPRKFLNKSDGSAISGTAPTYDKPAAGDEDDCKKREVILSVPVSNLEARVITTPYDFRWLTSLAAW